MSRTDGRETARLIRAMLLTIAALILIRPAGLILASMLVAIGAVYRRLDAVTAMVMCALVIGWLAPMGGFGAGLFNAAIVLVPGWIVGMGILAGGRYGRIVTVTTVVLFAFFAGLTASMQDAVTEISASWAAVLDGPDRSDYTEQALVLLEVQRWVLDHWREVSRGFAFTTALAWACILTSSVLYWLSRTKAPVTVVGGFRTLRPPDWMVWLAIGTAFLWFADQRWPNETFRVLSWNAAIGLFGLYWLNGLSVVVYAVGALKPNPVMVALVAFSAILLNLIGLLAIVGLFDTWGEWRRKIDDVLAARELRENSHDDSP